MKIMMITRKFAPEDPGSSGTEKYILDLCNSFSRENEIVVVTAYKNSKVKNHSVSKSRSGNIDIIRIASNYIPIINIISDPLFYVRDKDIERIFRQILLDERPDVVHIHQLGYLSFGMIDTARSMSIPVVITLHDYGFICTQYHRYSHIYRGKGDPHNSCGMLTRECEKCFSGLYLKELTEALTYRFGGIFGKIFSFLLMALLLIRRRSMRSVFKMRIDYASSLLCRADKLIAPSNSVKDIFSCFLPANKITVIPHGIDTAKIQKRTASPRTPLRFGFIGGLQAHKGAMLLLNSISQIKDNLELYMYGSDYMSNDNLPHIKRLMGDNRIKFMGVFRDPNVAFAEFDSLIIPSLFEETFSLAAHEAFAAGLPVIAPRSGPFPEYINDSVNGLLFTPGDAEDLRNKIVLLIQHPELTSKFRENAPRVKDFLTHSKEIMQTYLDMTGKEA